MEALVKVCKTQSYMYTLHLRPLTREGSLSCHTFCDTRLRFSWSRPKDPPPPFKSPFTTSNGHRRPIPTRILAGFKPEENNDFAVRYMCKSCLGLKFDQTLQKNTNFDVHSLRIFFTDFPFFRCCCCCFLISYA